MGICLSPALDLYRPNYSYWESHSYEPTQTKRLRILAGKYVQGIGTAKALPFLFIGWFWRLASILWLAIGRRWQHHPNAGLSTVLSLSAMINQQPYLLVANTPFFRYFSWSVRACCVSDVLLTHSRARRNKINITH